jgi:hypothetical protein
LLEAARHVLRRVNGGSTLAVGEAHGIVSIVIPSRSDGRTFQLSLTRQESVSAKTAGSAHG